MAAEALLRSGFQVMVPLVDTGFDLLATKDGTNWRIQVKSTSSDGKNRSRVRIRRGAANNQTYTSEHCDAVVAVHTTKRLVVCMTLKQLNGRAWINFSDCSCANSILALK